MIKPARMLANGLVAGTFALLCATGATSAADQATIDAAKKEGKFVWYTGLVLTEAAKPLIDAFKAKYPGIEVEAARYAAPDILLRVQNEAQARNHVVDVVDGTAAIPALLAANFLQPYKSPEAEKYPAGLKDPNGLWTAGWQFFRTVAYNTDMIPPDEAPKNLEDLLDPKFKGMMAWADDPSMIGPPGFIHTVFTVMGEQKGMEYLKKLAAQDIRKVPASQMVVTGQVAEGQFAMNLTALTHHLLLEKYKTAPAKWIKIEPLGQIVAPIGLVKNAPHPNAAKLFIDFALSDQGQNILRDAGYIPANPSVRAIDDSLKPETGNFKAEPVGANETVEKLPRLTQIYKEIFK